MTLTSRGRHLVIVTLMLLTWHPLLRVALNTIIICLCYFSATWNYDQLFIAPTKQLWVLILRQKIINFCCALAACAWWAQCCLERWAARVYNLEANDNAEGWFIKLSYPKHPAHYDFRRRHPASSEREDNFHNINFADDFYRFPK